MEVGLTGSDCSATILRRFIVSKLNIKRTLMLHEVTKFDKEKCYSISKMTIVRMGVPV